MVGLDSYLETYERSGLAVGKVTNVFSRDVYLSEVTTMREEVRQASFSPACRDTPVYVRQTSIPPNTSPVRHPA